MISLVSGTIGILVGFIIILLIRKDRLHIQHGLGWIMVAVGFALLGFSPSAFDYIARHLGIAYSPILALILSIAMLETELKTLKDAVIKSNSPVDLPALRNNCNN